MHAHPGVHMMRGVGDGPDEALGIGGIHRLAEQFALEVDGGVGGHDHRTGSGHHGRLAAGQAFHIGGAGLPGQHGFIDIGRSDLEGQPEFVEQAAAAR